MSGARPSHRVLVVEDDADTRHNLRDILEMDHFRVDTAGSVAEALDRSDWDGYLAIILDRRLPDGDADRLLPRLKVLAPDAAMIISTGYADFQSAVAALRQQAFDYLQKPIDSELLRAALARAVERRHLALAKQRSEAAFRALVEQAPCMVVIMRGDGAIVYFSPFAQRLTGYMADEVLGRNYFATFLSGEGGSPEAKWSMHRDRAAMLTPDYEAELRCKDGSSRWVTWNAQVLEDYDGDSAVLAVGLDVTASKEAHRKAMQAERLAAIGQMVTGLAHESRNALQRSQAGLELLAAEVEDRPEALDLVARIQKAQDHLHYLYEEVRNYAAPIKLHRKQHDLRRIWRDTWSHLEMARQGKDARLVEKCEAVDLRCDVDATALGQVFRNILENSLAACAAPVEIVVGCRDGEIHGAAALHVSLRDNGPGLAPQQAAHIFDPFYTTKTQGTGLGLAIAKRIVEGHGGRIGVGSDARRGLEIVITLPREAT